MVEIDPITGLPKELGLWDNVARENQKITVLIEKKRFGKEYTIVKGVDPKAIDLKDLAKTLKNKLACGGTAKDGQIELQGNHLDEVPAILIKNGFAAETIEIKK
ncbi:MAG: translation initiation factor [Candidatus Woesearchaeota archaeon]